MVKQSKPTLESNHCDAEHLMPIIKQLPEEVLVTLQKWLEGCEKQADITTSGLGCDENWDCWQTCQYMQHTVYQLLQEIKDIKDKVILNKLIIEEGVINDSTDPES